MSTSVVAQGERLFAAGRLMEAEDCFRSALQENHRNAEALNNLGVVLLAGGRTDQALACFAQTLEFNPHHRQALLNFAELSQLIGQTAIAIAGLRSYIMENPDDVEVRHLLERISEPRPMTGRIAVLCLPGLQSFVGDIIAHLEEQNQVRTCFSAAERQLEDAVGWADTIWLEWANELAVAVTNQTGILRGKRVVCRLHSYEAFTSFPGQIAWQQIDDLIFVAEHIRDFLFNRHPDIYGRVRRIHILPNGVDLTRFPLRRQDRGKNLAFLGSVNYKKGPMLLIHALAELVRHDPAYRLFVGGDFQDARFVLYFQQMARELGLEKNLFLDGRIDNVATWLADKDYIVSTSVLEGHPVGLLEAMACGLKPAIHNFVGAANIYPRRYLWNSIAEFVDMIQAQEYRPQEYRRFVADNFPLSRQLRLLDQIISSGCPQTQLRAEPTQTSL